MAIHLLPPQVANQIAAGEVVERPAAVVKELMENALDSGADSISVVIENGGSRLIQVRDNGSGIPRDELPLALKRHATSKITSIEDLDHLLSMGFRGEALASIAAVSRLLLVSRPREQEMAWAVSVEGLGQDPELHPAAYPEGTSVEVRDLFFNTPARRRFLRSEKTEFLQIEEIFRRLALSRREVAFSLKNARHSIYDLRKAQDEKSYRERLKSIIGNGFLNDLLQFSEESSGICFSGYVNPAPVAHPCQYFFVNGRIVKDKTLVHAINTAFEDEFGEKRSVQYVFFLEMDPGEVDINVHPQKYEVRFQKANEIHDFIALVLKNSLRRAQQLLPETLEETMNPDPEHGYTPRPIAVRDSRIQDLRRESLGTKSFRDTGADAVSEEQCEQAIFNANSAAVSSALSSGVRDSHSADAAIIDYDGTVPASSESGPDEVYRRLFGNRTGKKEEAVSVPPNSGQIFSAPAHLLPQRTDFQNGSVFSKDIARYNANARAQEFSKSLLDLSRANPIGGGEKSGLGEIPQNDGIRTGICANSGRPSVLESSDHLSGSDVATGYSPRTDFGTDLETDLLPWIDTHSGDSLFVPVLIPERDYVVARLAQQLFLVNTKKLAASLFIWRLRERLKMRAGDLLRRSDLPVPFYFHMTRSLSPEMLNALAELGFVIEAGLYDAGATAVPALVRGSDFGKFFRNFLGDIDEAAVLDELQDPAGQVTLSGNGISVCTSRTLVNAFFEALFLEKTPTFFSQEMTERILRAVPDVDFIAELSQDVIWEIPLEMMIREHFSHD